MDGFNFVLNVVAVVVILCLVTVAWNWYISKTDALKLCIKITAFVIADNIYFYVTRSPDLTVSVLFELVRAPIFFGLIYFLIQKGEKSEEAGEL